MKHCQNCGSLVSLVVPEGDNRHRHVCEDKVLLCKRAINPRYEFWTLPAGFMENEESLEQAALRESAEEANAALENLRLYTVLSLPHISQVYMMFLADLKNTDFSPGLESLQTELFAEKDIPWKKLAFKTIDVTLRHYFLDRKHGKYPLHSSTIEKKNH